QGRVRGELEQLRVAGHGDSGLVLELFHHGQARGLQVLALVLALMEALHDRVQLRALLGLPGAVEFLRQAVQPRPRVVEGQWVRGLLHSSVFAHCFIAPAWRAADVSPPVLKRRCPKTAGLRFAAPPKLWSRNRRT